VLSLVRLCRADCSLWFQEAGIHNAAAQYQRTSEAGLAGINAERAAFALVNRELEACTPGPSRVRALGRNHTLWAILVQDLSLAENRLPEGIKTELMGLGLWSMRYSTLALLKDLPLDPVIDVNRNVAEGLQAQGSPLPATAGVAYRAAAPATLGAPISV
jgi:flagellar protein FlaF